MTSNLYLLSPNLAKSIDNRTATIESVLADPFVCNLFKMNCEPLTNFFYINAKQLLIYSFSKSRTEVSDAAFNIITAGHIGLLQEMASNDLINESIVDVLSDNSSEGPNDLQLSRISDVISTVFTVDLSNFQVYFPHKEIEIKKINSKIKEPKRTSRFFNKFKTKKSEKLLRNKKYFSFEFLYILLKYADNINIAFLFRMLFGRNERLAPIQNIISSMRFTQNISSELFHMDYSPSFAFESINFSENESNLPIFESTSLDSGSFYININDSNQQISREKRENQFNRKNDKLENENNNENIINNDNKSNNKNENHNNTNENNSEKIIYNNENNNNNNINNFNNINDGNIQDNNENNNKNENNNNVSYNNINRNVNNNENIHNDNESNNINENNYNNNANNSEDIKDNNENEYNNHKIYNDSYDNNINNSQNNKDDNINNYFNNNDENTNETKIDDNSQKDHKINNETHNGNHQANLTSNSSSTFSFRSDHDEDFLNPTYIKMESLFKILNTASLNPIFQDEFLEMDVYSCFLQRLHVPYFVIDAQWQVIQNIIPTMPFSTSIYFIEPACSILHSIPNRIHMYHCYSLKVLSFLIKESANFATKEFLNTIFAMFIKFDTCTMLHDSVRHFVFSSLMIPKVNIEVAVTFAPFLIIECQVRQYGIVASSGFPILNAIYCMSLKNIELATVLTDIDGFYIFAKKYLKKYQDLISNEYGGPRAQQSQFVLNPKSMCV